MTTPMKICWAAAGLLAIGMVALPAQAKETLCYFLIDAEGNVKSYREPPYPLDDSGRELSPEELEKRKKMGHLVISMTSQPCGKEKENEVEANKVPASPDKPVSPPATVTPKPPAAAAPAPKPAAESKPKSTETPVALPPPAKPPAEIPAAPPTSPATPPPVPESPVAVPPSQSLQPSPAASQGTIKEVSKFLGLQPPASGKK